MYMLSDKDAKDGKDIYLLVRMARICYGVTVAGSAGKYAKLA